MPRRADVNQVVNAGFESSIGSLATPIRRLISTQIAIQPKSEATEFVASGYKVDTLVSQGKEWGEGSVSMIGNFEEVQYLLDSAFGAVTPTSPGTGIVRRRVWAPPAAGDTVNPRTLSLEKGDYAASPRGLRMLGCQMTDFGLTWDRSSLMFASKFFGRIVDTTISMTPVGTNAVYTLTAVGTISGGTFTLTVAAQTTAAIAANATAAQIQTALDILSTVGGNNYVVSMNQATFGTGAIVTIKAANNFAGTVAPAITGTFTSLTGGTSSTVTATAPGTAGVSELTVHQALPKNMTVYADDTFANIGSTVVPAAYAGAVGVTDRYAPTWPVNAANTSWADEVEQANKATSSITLEADANGEAYYTQLRAGTKKYIRLAITGRTLESGFTDKLWIDFPVFVLQPNDYTSQDGVYALPWDFTLANDADFGGYIRVTLDNALTGN